MSKWKHKGVEITTRNDGRFHFQVDGAEEAADTLREAEKVISRLLTAAKEKVELPAFLVEPVTSHGERHYAIQVKYCGVHIGWQRHIVRFPSQSGRTGSRVSSSALLFRTAEEAEAYCSLANEWQDLQLKVSEFERKTSFRLYGLAGSDHESCLENQEKVKKFLTSEGEAD